jgi:hypothetical protein
MSDSTSITPEPIPGPMPTPIPSPEGWVAPPAPNPPKPGGGLALAALIVGIGAIVCAVIPGLSFVAFIPALTAAGLGIAALARKLPGHGKAIAAVILGPVALLIAIIVSIATIAVGMKPAVTAEHPSTQQSSTAPGSKPTPTQAAPKEGTRANPAPVGTTVEISDASGPIWQVTMGAANLNAGDAIAAENQFNPPADAGSQYVMVPVTYTYVGTKSGTPWISVRIVFVSAAGTTHEEKFVVAPTPISGIAEMYTGASATGNLVVMVPSQDVEKGTWGISTVLSDKYFVAVQ